MDIEDAFSQRAIQEAEATLDEQEEQEVRTITQGLIQTDDVSSEDIALFAFMAGRAYQNDLIVDDMIPIMMNRVLANKIMQIMADELNELL